MLEISAKLRQETGKGNQTIRNQGLIPAILYGHKVKNIPLVVNSRDFEKIYQEAGESTLLKLKIDNKETKSKERMVLIHEVAKDPINDKVIHIDFYQPRMDEVISAEVPLEFIGRSPAVIDLGGVMVKNIHQLEIEALPKDLPREIKVDISSLKTFENIVHIKDLTLPEGVKTKYEPEEVVVSVIPPRTEEEIEKLEEAPEEKVEEVKVEAEEKQKVEAEEEAEEEPKSFDKTQDKPKKDSSAGKAAGEK